MENRKVVSEIFPKSLPFYLVDWNESIEPTLGTEHESTLFLTHCHETNFLVECSDEIKSLRKSKDLMPFLTKKLATADGEKDIDFTLSRSGLVDEAISSLQKRIEDLEKHPSVISDSQEAFDNESKELDYEVLLPETNTTNILEDKKAQLDLLKRLRHFDYDIEDLVKTENGVTTARTTKIIYKVMVSLFVKDVVNYFRSPDNVKNLKDDIEYINHYKIKELQCELLTDLDNSLYQLGVVDIECCFDYVKDSEDNKFFDLRFFYLYKLDYTV